jgi:membrane associated rhomboid family serine protease
MSSVLLIVALNCAFLVGMLARGDPAIAPVAGGRQARWRYPTATVALFVLVAIPSLLQVPFPRVLTALQRNADLILHHAEWWRVVTSLVVQDGGVAGTVFNLAYLLLLGLLAERLWGWRLLVLFFGTGILSQFVGLAWQPVGGGNSVGNFGMATGILLLGALRASLIQIRLLSVVGILAGLGLLLFRDIHGGAVAIGLILNAMLLMLTRSYTLAGNRH